MKIILFVAIILLSSNSFAQNRSPYEVTPEVEIPITVGAFAALGMSRLFSSEFSPPHCGLDCDPYDLNGFDRTAIKMYSTEAKIVSDVLFVGGIIFPYTAGIINEYTSETEDGLSGFLTDTLVLTETLAFTLVLNNLLDVTTRRPRPYAYNDEVSAEERLDPNASFSFPSGHTAVVFAMGTAYSRLYMKRHPESDWIIPIWIGAYTAGTMTGVSRVLAGEHFWTDIMAGAALGISSGLFIPWMHERDIHITPTVGQNLNGLIISNNW